MSRPIILAVLSIAALLPALAPSQAATLAEIRQRGYLVAAVSNESSAFATVTDGKRTGFDADLLAALGKEGGFEIRTLSLSPDALAAAVLSGKADLVASSVEITPEAQAQGAFGPPLAETTLTYVTRAKDTNIEGFKDLGGRRFGVRSDSAAFLAQTALEHKLAKAGVVLGAPVEYDDTAAATKDLAAGKVDYVLDDLADLAAATRGQAGFVFGEPVTLRSFAAWETAKGNDELAGFVRDFLLQERQKGDLAKLQQASFGRSFTDMPDAVTAQNWWVGRSDRPKSFPIPSIKDPD